MRIDISFSGLKGVVAEFDGFKVLTDQPVADGGEGRAPAPFDMFLASIATCAGYYVRTFCDARQISLDGVRVSQEAHWDDAKSLYTRVEILIALPPTFPEKYRNALLTSVNACSVKKHLANAPLVESRIVG